MAPAQQQYLYTQPNDLWAWLSIAGVDMRLDDQNSSTGQNVLATATAVEGATSVSIAALPWPLLKGTNLQFEGGGMSAVVPVVLTGTASTGATSLSVAALEGDVAAQATARDSGVNVAMAQNLIRACCYGTDKVNRYCMGRYNPEDLITSWSANEWATIWAAWWLCSRVLRSIPQAVKAAWEGKGGALDELKMVMSSQMQVPGIGTRSAGWPFIDNVTVNPAYYNHKIRLQQTMSDPQNTQFGTYVDWSDALGYDWGWW